jgi:hypothetical protein
VRHYWEPVVAACATFQYGGCAGNSNNFLSSGQCSAACGAASGAAEVRPVAAQPAQGGAVGPRAPGEGGPRAPGAVGPRAPGEGGPRAPGEGGPCRLEPDCGPCRGNITRWEGQPAGLTHTHYTMESTVHTAILATSRG